MEPKKDEQEWQDDDKVVFLPPEEIEAIGNILDKLEQVQQELGKVAEGMKSMISKTP